MLTCASRQWRPLGRGTCKLPKNIKVLKKKLCMILIDILVSYILIRHLTPWTFKYKFQKILNWYMCLYAINDFLNLF